MSEKRGAGMFDLSMKRSQFLRAAGVAAASTALAGAAHVALANEAADGEAWDYETDVVVCGCGTSGAPAAIAAADAGAQVIVIEKMDWLGGEMRRCGGGVAGAGTKVQAALGVEDNADDFYDYLMAIGGSEVDPDMVRVVADNAAPTVDWIIDDLGGQPVDQWHFCGGDEGLENLMDAGLNIGTDPANYTDNGMTPIARCHWFDADPDDPFHGDPDKGLCTYPGGTGLWKTFEKAIEAREAIQTMTSTALVSFVSDESGVTGVVAEQDGKQVRIKANKGVSCPGVRSQVPLRVSRGCRHCLLVEPRRPQGRHRDPCHRRERRGYPAPFRCEHGSGRRAGQQVSAVRHLGGAQHPLWPHCGLPGGGSVKPGLIGQIRNRIKSVT